MSYFVSRDGKQYGPYSAETIRKYLAEGSLLVSDSVRGEAQQTWQPLGQVFGPPVVSTPVRPPVSTTSGGVPGAPVQSVVMPPDLHWAVVLLLGITVIFTFVWVFVQARWVRKLDPASNGIVAFVIWTISIVVYYVFCIAIAMQPGSDSEAMFGILILVSMLVGLVSFYIGIYGLRRSMLNYFNSTENIQLRLSGVMTFFFSIYYLQYHMSRIARWKRTGILEA
jgi:vacuolar-type H+-ATPase subunit I/STV1